MSTATLPKQYTPDDLLTMPEGDRYELVNGELVERHMGYESAWVAGRILQFLAVFCDAHDLGWVSSSEAGFQCFTDDPNRVRKPDVALVRRGKFPGERPPQGHARAVPDLVVEVVSPKDLFEKVDKKVEEYLKAGVRWVWVVNPRTRTVMVHCTDGSVRKFREPENLVGEEFLAGFTCPVSALFPPPIVSEKTAKKSEPLSPAD
jgi:Uma2 family endonuclease